MTRREAQAQAEALATHKLSQVMDHLKAAGISEPGQRMTELILEIEDGEHD